MKRLSLAIVVVAAVMASSCGFGAAETSAIQRQYCDTVAKLLGARTEFRSHVDPDGSLRPFTSEVALAYDVVLLLGREAGVQYRSSWEELASDDHIYQPSSFALVDVETMARQAYFEPGAVPVDMNGLHEMTRVANQWGRYLEDRCPWIDLSIAAAPTSLLDMAGPRASFAEIGAFGGAHGQERRKALCRDAATELLLRSAWRALLAERQDATDAEIRDLIKHYQRWDSYEKLSMESLWLTRPTGTDYGQIDNWLWSHLQFGNTKRQFDEDWFADAMATREALANVVTSQCPDLSEPIIEDAVTELALIHALIEEGGIGSLEN